MMTGFIGLDQPGRQTLLNIHYIVSISGDPGGIGVRIDYLAGAQLQHIFLPDASIDHILGGIMAASEAGIALPHAMMEALKRKGDLDS